jgi:hypothetical protein
MLMIRVSPSPTLHSGVKAGWSPFAACIQTVSRKPRPNFRSINDCASSCSISFLSPTTENRNTADGTIVRLSGTAMTSTPSSQLPAMEVTDVAAEGDMILTLQHSRLRVSSVILASASPVFKVMMGPAFLEGRDFRSAQYPKEIPLEDDSTAMTRLCFMLHHRRYPKCSPPQDIPLVDGAEGLFALAVVADKYSCTDAVGMATGNLLAYNLISTGMPRHLIMDHVTTLSKAAVHSAIDVLPQHFLRMSDPFK